jgi:hypothetical protein
MNAEDASNVDAPSPGNPRTAGGVVAEDKPPARAKSLTSPQQQLVEKGPTETVQSLLADLNAEANERLAAFLVSDQSRLAAAANDDGDEELSNQIPILEDDDGHSCHSSDDDSGNGESATGERKITTPPGWEHTNGPGPCQSVRHGTVGVSITSSST